jgi:hypothetical protein
MRTRNWGIVVASAIAGLVLAACQPAESGVVLLQGSVLFVEKDNLMAWAGNVNVGETLKILAPAKTAIRESDKAERDFVKVQASDGKEYWVQDLLFASKAAPAVVIANDSIVYSKPDPTGATSNLIPNLTLVGVYDGSAADGFVQISAYFTGANGKDQMVSKQYVKQEVLTKATADVKGYKLWTLAKTKKDQPTVEKELLKNALAAGSRWNDQIQADYDLLTGSVTIDSGDKSQPGNTLTVNDDNVNVRSTPDEVNGTVITTLAKGTVVTFDNRTQNSYTINGATKHWYHILQPDGWVFGAFLDNAQ